MKPLISVQIPVKDGGDKFSICLDSLRGQETGGDPWELLIIDDCSSRSIEDHFDLDFPDNVDVRVLKRRGHGNRPAARNMAWQSTKAPISFLSDGDIRFPADILQGHLDLHGSGVGDVIMGARIDAWMEDASSWQRWFDTRGMGDRKAGPFPERYFVTGNISLLTSLLETCGGFDPAIDRYGGEDTEFGYRLARKNPRLFWDPSLKVYHLDRITAREHSRKMVEYGGSGLKYTLERIPESAGLLGSDWIKPVFAAPAGPGAIALRLITRLTLAVPIYRIVLRWMERVGAPGFLFTYLSVGGCLLGLSGRNFE